MDLATFYILGPRSGCVTAEINGFLGSLYMPLDFSHLQHWPRKGCHYKWLIDRLGSSCSLTEELIIIISPNEVFGDIMVLASPPRPRPPRPPVDPDDVNTPNSTNIQPISFKFYMRVDSPLRYFAIEMWYPPMTRTTAFAAKRHSYPPNSSKCNISITNGTIAFKF